MNSDFNIRVHPCSRSQAPFVLSSEFDTIQNMKAKEYYAGLEKESINCPICNSSDQTKLAKGDRYAMGIETCGCNQCGLIFVNPRPTAAEMKNFYETSYRKFYESTEKPSEQYVLDGPFIPRAKFVVQCLLKSIDSKQPIKVLDIGCAEGTLLKTIGDAFPNATLVGTEPDPNFADYAQQTTRAKISTGDFASFLDAKTETGFDLVTFTHVLEHILDPNDFMQQVKSVLKPDGLCYVEVPNIHSKETSRLGQVHLGHVLSMSPPNLEFLVLKNGFDVVEQLVSGLPARTPAMAILAKNTDESDRNPPLIPRDKVEAIFARYRENVAMNILAQEENE